MEGKRKVTKIELNSKKQELRVAAYARVSSDSKDQLHSVYSQTDYYSQKILSMKNVIFAGVYIDEGITGTRMEHREGFQKMMHDCQNKRIDRILTKSISRFARNIVETLVALRELKAMGVSVYFEQENLDTSKSGSEVILSIYSALAEMESRNIALNQRWAFRKRAEQGIYNQPKLPYGYKRNENHEIVINEAEAMIVRAIFRMHVEMNMSTIQIRNYLNANHIGNRTWSQNGLVNMLVNERYCGDMLLQKKYTTDEFPYRLVRNNGDIEQYYVYDAFPKIIEREMLEKSQCKIMASRMKYNRNQTSQNNRYALTSKVQCSICGSTFKRRKKNGVIYWGCSKHVEKADACPVRTIAEEELKEGAISVFHRLKENIYMLEEYLVHASDVIKSHEMTVTDQETEHFLSSFNERISKLHEECTKKQISITDFHRQLIALQNRRENIEMKRKQAVKNQMKKSKRKETEQIVQMIRNCEIHEFDEELFRNVIDRIAVSQDSIDYILKNNFVISIKRKQVQQQ